MPSKRKAGAPLTSGPRAKGTNSQAKLKYIHTCIVAMIDSLPRQTFDFMGPREYETSAVYAPVPEETTGPVSSSSSALGTTTTSAVTTTPSTRRRKPPTPAAPAACPDPTAPLTATLSSSSPVLQSQPLVALIPRHPNVHVTCPFCHTTFNSLQAGGWIDQPQSRRRYTLLCDRCASEYRQ